MIEVVYKDEKQRAKGNEGIFQLPRNVRQIGMTDQNYRIYMEDYVYTFLGRVAAVGENKEEKERCLAVLMGETKWDAGTGYLFIRGAVLVLCKEISQEHVEFTDAMWQQIHEDTEKYFEGEEIFLDRGYPIHNKDTQHRVSKTIRFFIKFPLLDVYFL